MFRQSKHSLNRNFSQQGFAIPVAVGFGLIIILVSATLLTRSRDDQMTAAAQKATTGSLAVAEAGLTRVQSFIASNRIVAAYNFSDWKTASTSISGLSACGSGGNATTISNFANAAANWQNLDSTDPSKGQYKIVNYTYSNSGHSTPGTGTLIVGGRLPNQTSRNYVQVTIPVLTGSIVGVPIPGVWVGTGGTGNNTFQANVLLNDCTVSPSSTAVTGTDPTTGQPYAAKNTNLQFPDLPAKPTTYNTLSPTISSDTTLPRSGDVQNPVTGAYEYIVTGDINISNSKALTIQAGKKVTFYLNNGISKGGNIVHDCSTAPNGTACGPTDFQIFGYGPVGSQICMMGNGFIEGFILAPNYAVGVAGSGGGVGGIKGAVWSGDWSNSSGCGSNTSNIVAVQTANWASLGLVPKNLPPQLSPVSSWQKTEEQ